MNIYEIITRLDGKIMRISNTDYYPADITRNLLRQLETVIITWSVEDFESRAKENTGDDWEQYYNKDMFQKSLKDMIEKHDANIGINWDVIDYYLETFCRIKSRSINHKK
jgi:hypothetical protein